LDISHTIFDILTHKAGKLLAFPTLPCLMSTQGDPLEFLGETYPAKTRGMGRLYGKYCIILTSTIFE